MSETQMTLRLRAEPYSRYADDAFDGVVGSTIGVAGEPMRVTAARVIGGVSVELDVVGAAAPPVVTDRDLTGLRLADVAPLPQILPPGHRDEPRPWPEDVTREQPL